MAVHAERFPAVRQVAAFVNLLPTYCLAAMRGHFRCSAPAPRPQDTGRSLGYWSRSCFYWNRAQKPVPRCVTVMTLDLMTCHPELATHHALYCALHPPLRLHAAVRPTMHRSNHHCTSRRGSTGHGFQRASLACKAPGCSEVCQGLVHPVPNDFDFDCRQNQTSKLQLLRQSAAPNFEIGVSLLQLGY